MAQPLDLNRVANAPIKLHALHPPPSADPTQRGICCRTFAPALPENPAASVRDYCSAAYNHVQVGEAEPDPYALHWRLSSNNCRRYQGLPRSNRKAGSAGAELTARGSASPPSLNRWTSVGLMLSRIGSPGLTRWRPRTEADTRSPDCSTAWIIVSAPRISLVSTRAASGPASVGDKCSGRRPAVNCAPEAQFVAATSAVILARPWSTANSSRAPRRRPHQLREDSFAGRRGSRRRSGCAAGRIARSASRSARRRPPGGRRSRRPWSSPRPDRG